MLEGDMDKQPLEDKNKGHLMIIKPIIHEFTTPARNLRFLPRLYVCTKEQW